MHRSMHCIREASHWSRLGQIQKLTDRQYAESERLEHSALNQISLSNPLRFREPCWPGDKKNIRPRQDKTPRKQSSFYQQEQCTYELRRLRQHLWTRWVLDLKGEVNTCNPVPNQEVISNWQALANEKLVASKGVSLRKQTIVLSRLLAKQ